MSDATPVNMPGCLRSISFQVTDLHLLVLSTAVRNGEAELTEGMARFLAAIAPHVWPGLIVKVEPLPMEPGREIPLARFAVVRLYKVTVQHRITLRATYRGFVEDLHWTTNTVTVEAKTPQEARDKAHEESVARLSQAYPDGEWQLKPITLDDVKEAANA